MNKNLNPIDKDAFLIETEFNSIIERLEPFSQEEVIEVEVMSIENHRTLLEHNTKIAYETLEREHDTSLAMLELQRNSKNGSDALQWASIIIGAASTYTFWQSCIEALIIIIGKTLKESTSDAKIYANIIAIIFVLGTGFYLYKFINKIISKKQKNFRIVIPIRCQVKMKELYDYLNDSTRHTIRQDGIGNRRIRQWEEDLFIDNRFSDDWELLRIPMGERIEPKEFKITIEYDKSGIIYSFIVEAEYSQKDEEYLKSVKKSELIIQILLGLWKKNCFPVKGIMNPKIAPKLDKQGNHNYIGSEYKKINEISLFARIMDKMGIELNHNPEYIGIEKLMAMKISKLEEIFELYEKDSLSDGFHSLSDEDHEFISRLVNDKGKKYWNYLNDLFKIEKPDDPKINYKSENKCSLYFLQSLLGKDNLKIKMGFIDYLNEQRKDKDKVLK